MWSNEINEMVKGEGNVKDTQPASVLTKLFSNGQARFSGRGPIL
jgi:hypothetical protein